jgi:hypothetical protein
MFYFFALFLLLLSMASGISLLLISFGLVIKGSSVAFWLLYIIGFLGCIGLMSKISTINMQQRIIQFASGFQVLLGITAAIAIFLDKLMIIESSDAMILWILFFFGISIGLWGLSRVSQMRSSES